MNEFQEKILRICNENSKNTLMETLDIEYVEVGENFLVAKMPVTPKVYQPDGILHGGATAALAESVGSAASYIFLDGNEYFVRGLEITANHVKSVKDGNVYAKASIIHRGRTTQLWEIRVTNDAEELVSLCKLTTISLPRKK
ncbi:MAG: PaaI family thioesterase [Cellulophaga fucicola]